MDTLPDGVTIAEVTRHDGLTAPAIWVGGAGSVEIAIEPLAMAFWLTGFHTPYSQIERVVKTVGRLMRFYILQGRPSLDVRGLRNLVEVYFLARCDGAPELGWAPQTRQALETELSHIEIFSNFCERHFGHLSLLGDCSVPLPSPSDASSFWQLMDTNQTDFFHHLAARRETKIHRIRLPGRKMKRSGSRSASCMDVDFAWRIIEAEKNITYKALWLLGFFGGPRISESANLWVCDVLPGTWRQHWFLGDIFYDLPLVVIANPWTSKWTGNLQNQRIERQIVLKNKYGLRPRPEMKQSKYPPAKPGALTL